MPLKKLGKKLKEKAGKKFAKVMREFYAGKLHHGSTGKIVTDVKVARAIAASEAGVWGTFASSSGSRS